jgi:hypothetical protein
MKSEYMMKYGEDKGMATMLREAIDAYIESQS